MASRILLRKSPPSLWGRASEARGGGTVVLHSPDSLRCWGRNFAKTLHRGNVVALMGPMGVGKTTLAQGIAEGWGCRTRATSPTFALTNEYRSKRGFLFHMDMYRLSKRELKTFPLEDYLGEGVCVIEWADRIRDRWPERTLEIRLKYAGRNGRSLTLKR